jgi:cysteine desulfurase/selenocysteine lyase
MIIEHETATSLPSYDVDRIRADFPILKSRVHGHPLVYLDNAATTQKPQAVIDALVRYYTQENANVHRGVYQLSAKSTERYEEAREAMRAYLHARSSSEIVFLRGATEAINLVAHSFGQAFVRSGDEIVVTEIEHHSNIVPWQMLCARTGARLRVIPVNDAGDVDLEQAAQIIGPRTRLVAFSHVSNALGTILPVAELTALAHAYGAAVLVDGAQAASHMAVDVRRLGCDFYVCSGHKMYGPTGIGALYAQERWLEEMPPWQGGGDMIETVRFDRTTYAAAPAKFEAGTPNIAGACGLTEALRYLQGLGLSRITRHEKELLAYATSRMSELKGVRIIGTSGRKAAVLSFVVEGVHPHDVGTLLDQHGIAVRAGHHCAMPTIDHYHVPATVRASFALYNTREEVDRFIEALTHVQEVFRP